MAIVKTKTLNTILVRDNPKTFLSSDTNSGVSTLSVKSTIGFQNNDVIILGTFGNEGAEILALSTTPSSGVFALISSPLMPHSASTPIQTLLYDKVEVSNASTKTGAKTTLGTIAIVADDVTTNYNDNSGSTGYYFIRFYNSNTSSYSSYSDPIPITGYTIYSARDIINKALAGINKTTSDLLTDEFEFGEIDNCQIETLREFKRWSFMQVFDSPLTAVTTGQWRVALPTDCDDQNTNRAIWNFRIGTSDNLDWVDKEKWNEMLQSVAHTTLSANINVGDGSITLVNSGDFPSAGTVTIGANQYQYTVNTVSTGVLTLSAVSTTTNTAGEDVFNSATSGTPKYWTVHDGYIYFYPILGSTLSGQIPKLDYYKKVSPITTDTTEIVLNDPTVVQYYLQWKSLLRINNGMENTGSMAKKNDYDSRVKKLKQKETLGRAFKLKPRLNQINVNDNVDDKQIRLGNFIN